MKQDKLYWHNAFTEALKAEFKESRNILNFTDEYMLSKESLKIDMVIEKDKNARVHKNIGEIFKGHNLFEFKSETDY